MNSGYNHDSFRLFISQLKEKDDNEIDGIITRYSLYKPEMVDAALHAAVERGFIPYDLRESLASQIHFNLSDESMYRKQKNWERDNAFKGYVSRYSDDEIYDIIDKPSDRIIDVYHAVLLVARERELIGEDDFKTMFTGSLNALRSEEEIEREETDGFFREIFQEDIEVSAEVAEQERRKYWKCPGCGEAVGMDFAVCWNCNTGIPENPERPDREEMIKELKSYAPAKPARIGLVLILSGIMVMGISWMSINGIMGFRRSRYIELVFGGIAVVAGIVFLIYSMFSRSSK